ncbi:hypothetical protein P7L53_10750 [Thermoleptolyngbya sichuanensis XZ-Cy5]|uniref:hypothetical protein n=1 Tax=Thermoleptolyngbya sichuanensis TaxID=2885951 RepID=UPI00240E49D3|nr:hypothetical protein [Thermoleptolyngbya sichuanensis]MDG2616724.1 hypothetical protein [Thermoleptolyngbya sichuanensis XZ-Cy5]
MSESHGGGGGGAAPRSSLDERPQVWIVGTRDQVIHLMNEFYVKKDLKRSGKVHAHRTRALCQR